MHGKTGFCFYIHNILD